MKKLFFMISLFAVMGLSVGCDRTSKSVVDKDSVSTDSFSLIGKWTTVDPIDSTKDMGVELKDKGKAASINMATLPYESWKQVDDSTLVIKGKSLGNGQTENITDTFMIDVRNKTLKQHGCDVVYTKK
jgi:hypothetical protein